METRAGQRDLATDPPRRALAMLRAEPAYARLLLGGFISGLGDWFNTVALLGLTLHLTGSPLAAGVTLAQRTLLALTVAFVVEGASGSRSAWRPCWGSQLPRWPTH